MNAPAVTHQYEVALPRVVGPPTWKVLCEALGRPEAYEDWRDIAACRSPLVDPSVFFSGPGENDKLAAAKAVCLVCPVRKQCAAVGAGLRYGVWGGRSERQRRRTRQERQRQAVA